MLIVIGTVEMGPPPVPSGPCSLVPSPPRDVGARDLAPDVIIGAVVDLGRDSPLTESPLGVGCPHPPPLMLPLFPSLKGTPPFVSALVLPLFPSLKGTPPFVPAAGCAG